MSTDRLPSSPARARALLQDLYDDLRQLVDAVGEASMSYVVPERRLLLAHRIVVDYEKHWRPTLDASVKELKRLSAAARAKRKRAERDEAWLRRQIDGLDGGPPPSARHEQGGRS